MKVSEEGTSSCAFRYKHCTISPSPGSAFHTTSILLHLHLHSPCKLPKFENASQDEATLLLLEQSALRLQQGQHHRRSVSQSPLSHPLLRQVPCIPLADLVSIQTNSLCVWGF